MDLLCTYMLCVPCGKRRFCTSFSMCPCYLFLQALKTFPSYSNKNIWFFPRQEASNLEKNIPKPLLESFVATHISMKCGRRPKVSLLVCNTHSHEMWQDTQSLIFANNFLLSEISKNAAAIHKLLSLLLQVLQFAHPTHHKHLSLMPSGHSTWQWLLSRVPLPSLRLQKL